MTTAATAVFSFYGLFGVWVAGDPIFSWVMDRSFVRTCLSEHMDYAIAFTGFFLVFTGSWR